MLSSIYVEFKTVSTAKGYDSKNDYIFGLEEPVQFLNTFQLHHTSRQQDVC